MVFSRRPLNERVSVAVLAWLVLTGVILAIGLGRIESVSREAVVCESVCAQLLANTTEGRQALVSSVWYPPLAVLVRLPAAWLVRSGEWPVASVFLSAAFGALCLLLMERMLRDWSLGPGRLLLVGILAAAPDFGRACIDGSSSTLIVFLALTAAHGLARWTTVRQVRHLVRFGMGAALLVAASVEMIPWVAVLVLLLLLETVATARAPGQKEAVAILALLPIVYTGALWAVMNWLIMGDPVYPLRPWFAHAATSPLTELSSHLPVGLAHAVAAGVAVCALFLCDARSRRAGLCLCLLALVALLLALVYAVRQAPWDPAAPLVCLTPLALLALGCAAGFVASGPRWLRPLPWGAALLLGAVVIASSLRPPAGAGDVREFERIAEERERVLPGVARYARSRSPYSKVFVCGFESFVLLGQAPGEGFLYALDFNFNQAKREYFGRPLFVLVRRPSGRSARDSIHWKYDRLYALGSRETLYAGEWGDWRLFEIIQAPRSDL